jgi:hypothetical protein
MSTHMHQDACGCGGNCGCSGEHSGKVELTRDEYVLRLEAYLQDLKAEIEAVERELHTLREVA